MCPHDTTKVCRKCGETKPLTEFGRYTRYPDGLHRWCKACCFAYRRARPSYEPTDQEKECAQCGETKPAVAFQKNRYSKDGRASWCKECCHKYVYEDPDYRAHKLSYNRKRSKSPGVREHERVRYHTDPKTRSRVLSYMARRYRADAAYRSRRKVWNAKYRSSDQGRAKGALNSQRRRDRFRNLKNTLMHEQWREILREQHYKCLACGRAFGPQLKPTRDHIDPKKGLSRENCQALCGSCNSRKNAKCIDYRPLKQASFLDGDD